MTRSDNRYKMRVHQPIITIWLEYIGVSKTKEPIASRVKIVEISFYLKHHSGQGKTNILQVERDAFQL